MVGECSTFKVDEGSNIIMMEFAYSDDSVTAIRIATDIGRLVIFGYVGQNSQFIRF